MYLALDVTIVANSEESVRCRDFGLAVKLGAVSTQQFVAVDALDGRRRLLLLPLPPRVFAAAAPFVVVPDDADRPTDLAAAAAAAAAAAGLGGERRTSTPDDVGQLGDEEVVGQAPDAAARQRRARAAARARQVAVVRQQEPVRPVLLVHLVVRLEAVGAVRVLAGEHLRMAERARAEPTLEELVVQLLDEVRLNVAAIFAAAAAAVVLRRHGRCRGFLPHCASVRNPLLLYCMRVDPREVAGDARQRRRRGDGRLHVPLTPLSAPHHAPATAQCLRTRDVIANWRYIGLPGACSQHPAAAAAASATQPTKRCLQLACAGVCAEDRERHLPNHCARNPRISAVCIQQVSAGRQTRGGRLELVRGRRVAT